MSEQRATIVLIVLGKEHARRADELYRNVTAQKKYASFKRIDVKTPEEGLAECNKFPKPDIIVFAGAFYSGITFQEGVAAMRTSVK